MKTAHSPIEPTLQVNGKPNFLLYGHNNGTPPGLNTSKIKCDKHPIPTNREYLGTINHTNIVIMRVASKE